MRALATADSATRRQTSLERARRRRQDQAPRALLSFRKSRWPEVRTPIDRGLDRVEVPRWLRNRRRPVGGESAACRLMYQTVRYRLFM